MMFDFPDVLDTVAGRELFEEGMAKGKAELLVRMAAKRFGKLPASVEGSVLSLDYLQLEKLGDDILTLSSLAALTQWLGELKEK